MYKHTCLHRHTCAYLDLSGGYSGLYICQCLWSSVLKIYAFSRCKSYLNKLLGKKSIIRSRIAEWLRLWALELDLRSNLAPGLTSCVI